MRIALLIASSSLLVLGACVQAGTSGEGGSSTPEGQAPAPGEQQPAVVDQTDGKNGSKGGGQNGGKNGGKNGDSGGPKSDGAITNETPDLQITLSKAKVIVGTPVVIQIVKGTGPYETTLSSGVAAVSPDGLTVTATQAGKVAGSVAGTLGSKASFEFDAFSALGAASVAFEVTTGTEITVVPSGGVPPLELLAGSSPLPAMKFTPSAAGDHALTLKDAIGSAVAITVKARTLVTARAGFVARDRFAVVSDGFTSTPTCVDGSGNALTVVSEVPFGLSVSAKPVIKGLAADTTYAVTCKSPLEQATFTGRTFATSEVVIAAGSNDCMGHARIHSYDLKTGALDVFGQATGDCFATYDGEAWRFVRMTTADTDWSAYQVGIGLVHLPDGTRYALANWYDALSTSHYDRLYKCSANCDQAASWSSAVRGLTGLGQRLTYDAVGNRLVISNSSPAMVFECSLAADCMNPTSWNGVTLNALTAGNNQAEQFVDSQGNRWITFATSSKPLWVCPAGNDCTVGAQWQSGDLPGGPARIGAIGSIFEQDGKLRILGMTADETTWVAAECPLTSACTTPTSDVFTNFTVATEAIANVTGDYVTVTSTGYAHSYRDPSDGSKTKWRKCDGTFDHCKTQANWTAKALLASGEGHVWDLYFVRSATADAAGSPFSFVTNWGQAARLVYFAGP